MDPELERLHREEAALRAGGDYDGALQVLDRMLAIDPQCSPALNNKGSILTMRERYAEARPLIEAALAADPANAVAHNNLAVCLHHTGHHEQALTHAEAAWNGGYQHEGVLYNAGRIMLALGTVPRGVELMAMGFEGSSNPSEGMAFLQAIARVLDVDDHEDMRRFADELVAAAEQAIEETDVVRADPPLGSFVLRIKVDGEWFAMRCD
jgi:tetratricopeptide (TPR) repeat protein